MAYKSAATRMLRAIQIWLARIASLCLNFRPLRLGRPVPAPARDEVRDLDQRVRQCGEW